MRRDVVGRLLIAAVELASADDGRMGTQDTGYLGDFVDQSPKSSIRGASVLKNKPNPPLIQRRTMISE